jgi:predicted metal-dependent hydrolase
MQPGPASVSRPQLQIIEENAVPTVELKHRRMVLRVRPGTTERKRQAIVDEWYRNRLKKVVASLIGKWQLPIGVNVDRFFVQRMKTKWGNEDQVGQLQRQLQNDPAQHRTRQEIPSMP